MSFDSHVNFAQATVMVAPSDALNGTTFVLSPGDCERFAVGMPVTICPPDVLPTYDTAEIGYLSAISDGTATILRAQEDTIAKYVEPGWVVSGTVTAKSLTDIENAVSASGSNGMTPPLPPVQAANGSRATFSVAGTFVTDCSGSASMALSSK
jgi:hypothetical protein